MRLQWVGQACFFITAANGRSLLIDPFQRVIGLPRGQFPADVVVFSHNHLDHYDPGAVPPGAAIVAGPGFHNLNGFQCFGIQAFHDNREGLLSGEVTLYSFIVDGYRIVHLSDLGEDLDDYRLAQLGKPDILLFPAGEHTTITLRQAKALIDRIKPAVAIPHSFHIPGLVMPCTPLEEVIKIFPRHRLAATVELLPGQRLAPVTEIRILDALSYPPVTPM